MITYLIEFDKGIGYGLWIWNRAYKARRLEICGSLIKSDKLYSNKYLFWFKIKYLWRKLYDKI